MGQIQDVLSRIIVPGTKTEPNGISTHDGREKVEQAYSYIGDWVDSKWHPIHKVKELLHNNNLTFLKVDKPYMKSSIYFYFSFFLSLFTTHN